MKTPSPFPLHRRERCHPLIMPLLILLCATGATGFCQVANSQKIGYANVQVIAENMPEMRAMETELASLGGQLENQLKTKYDAYNQKLRMYEQKSSDDNAVSQNKRRDELMQLQEDIRKFSNDAEILYQKKQEQLMQPILLRIDKTIQEVANENSYSIIINTELPAGQRSVLFAVKEYDISELVLKKMGLSINQQKRE
jgi:outer membrane protein